MRVLRVASILPILSLVAGCVTSEEPSLKTGETMFPDESPETIQLATELAMGEVFARPELFEGVADMDVSRVNIERGVAHARLGQKVGGIPVFEGEAIVHLGADGQFDSVNDKFVREINVDLNPKLQLSEATDAAILEMGGKTMLIGEPQVDMQILRRDGKDHLTYRVQLEMRTVEDAPSMPVVFVDAHTGEVVWSFDNLQTARNRATYNAAQKTILPGTLVRSEG